MFDDDKYKGAPVTTRGPFIADLLKHYTKGRFPDCSSVFGLVMVVDLY